LTKNRIFLFLALTANGLALGAVADFEVQNLHLNTKVDAV
jgi:hypothetical protein